MSREHRSAAAFKRAQIAYDHMAPPEDGPHECLDCGGTKHDENGGKCPFCNGLGWTDENGYPFDPAQAERDRDSDMADRLYWREER